MILITYLRHLPGCILRAGMGLLMVGFGLISANAQAQAADDRRPGAHKNLRSEEQAILDDLSHRAFLFFMEQADPGTGLVRDRARTTGVVESEHDRDAASIAATGFGLTAFCVGVEHGWISRDEARKRVLATLHFFAERAPSEHGWFYHFMDAGSGKRKWKSELSSIDTALLLAGVLTAQQYFSSDHEITTLADTIYGRVDFSWMLNGDRYLLAMGWFPEKGFIPAHWDHYCELMILYLLAIASPTHSIPAESWYAWSRPPITYNNYHYIYGDRPLFVHQFAHAWIDFRHRRESRAPHIDWFENSVTATLAHKEYCLRLHSKFPGYSEDVWGITSSDSVKGYIGGWGGPPDDHQVDGTVVPCASAGSLMFTPQESLAALLKMKQLYGDRIYGRYGFADAFNPNTGWVDSDVIGIDVGITLLSAENLATGKVWKWFMRNRGIGDAMDRIGLTLTPGEQTSPGSKSKLGTLRSGSRLE
ncbi:MAG TPA: glucoamylase family protein [Terriglobia bacterium]|nr:glucoamylase family protein [Terriglobia bacterium]